MSRSFELIIVRIFFSVIVVAGFLFSSTTKAEAVPNLVAAYSFDEGTGISTNDASGNNHTGTTTNTTWSTSGKNGNALSFNGSSSRVDINDSSLLDLTNGMTLEAWVRPTTLTGFRTIIMKERSGGDSYALYANINANKPSGEIYRTNGYVEVRGTSKVANNTWTHLATTYDGTNLRIYVNGALKKTTTTSGNMVTSSNPLRIGANTIWGEYFNGLIDDVRIYNRALAESEIQGDMNTPVVSYPSITVTSPTNGATFVGPTVNITYTTAGDLAGALVDHVHFILDNTTPHKMDFSIDGSYQLNSMTAGSHTLSAYFAFDDHTAVPETNSNTVSFTVTDPDTTPPTVSVTSPAEGATVSDSTNVNADASDTSGIAGVQFLLNDVNLGSEDTTSPYSVSWNTVSASNGTHILTARARDTSNNTTLSTPVNITVENIPDTTPPTVSVTSPAEGATVSATINVTANASDDEGVTNVQFLLDGENLGAADTSSPYSTSWNTTVHGNGPHTLSARASDAAGNQSTSTIINVTVANGSTDPAQVGLWSAPVGTPGFVAQHINMLSNGKVLMWDGELPGGAGGLAARVLDPVTGAITLVPNSHTNLDCAGHSQLADGRIFTTGGATFSNAPGVKNADIFDPINNTWTSAPNMTYTRWYPTNTTLPNGRVLVMAGNDGCFDTSCHIDKPEIYDPVLNSWTTLTNAVLDLPTYPLNFVLPNGKIFVAGTYEYPTASYTLDINTQTWTTIDSRLIDGSSAVMYGKTKFMKAGSAVVPGSPTAPSAATTYAIDMNDTTPQWRQVADMNFPRAYHVLTLLPDGSTIVTGGGKNNDFGNLGQAVKEAEIWNPDTETWSTMSKMTNPRLYHGTAILLPDGRVLVAGSGRLFPGVNQENYEFFSPPYLFKGARPTITTSPATVQVGSTFFVETPDGATIQKVSLIRTGAMTHSFNADQRFVDLQFSQTAGGLNVTAPTNANEVPPGYYMMFLVNSNGVPSVAKFVRIPSTLEETEAPTTPADLIATGEASGINLSWTASTDNVGVVKYNIHRSTTSSFTPGPSNRIAQPTTTSYNDVPSTSGTYYYQITAEDLAGNVSAPSNEAFADYTADTNPPVVSITAPIDQATVSATISVDAIASDNVSVAGVQFKVDGTNIGSEDTSSPYSVSWNTTSVSNGNHTLTAVARDPSNNITTSSNIQISVSNSAPVTLLGNQTVESSDNSDPAGSAEAFPYTAVASGQTNKIYLYIPNTNSASQIHVGLYSTSGSNPGTLLTSGTINNPTGNAWNSVSVSAANITSGTKYWIAILNPAGGTLQFRVKSNAQGGTNSQSSSQSNLTSLPATWSAGSTWPTSMASAYVQQ